MKRSGSQKVLLVLSILTIIGAVISLLMAVFSFFGAGMLIQLPASDVASLSQETGMTQEGMGGLLAGLGIIGVVSALVGLIRGVFGLRASKDATKVGPLWVFSVIGLALSIASIVFGLVTGAREFSKLAGAFGGLLGSLIMFVIANNIKRQANA